EAARRDLALREVPSPPACAVSRTGSCNMTTSVRATDLDGDRIDFLVERNGALQGKLRKSVVIGCHQRSQDTEPVPERHDRSLRQGAEVQSGDVTGVNS